MKKTGKISRLIALVLLIGLGFSACASLSDSPSGTNPSKGGGSSSAGGGKASAQTADGGKASAQTAAGGKSAAGSSVKFGAKVQKTWSKSVGFVKSNWISLLIILAISVSGAYSCKKAKKKIKKPLKKRIVMASIILASLGLIYGVLHFGILRNDGNFKSFRPNQILKPIATKNKETKAAYAYVNTNRLNLRAGPSSSHKIIRGLPRNTRLELINSSGTWWKVKHEKTEGYVNSKYLRKA